MATRLNGLSKSDPVTPNAEWRVTLVVDPLEGFLIARFDSLVNNWLDGINGRGLAFQSSPVTKEGGINAKFVAVVDIKIIPLAASQGTVGQVVTLLDSLVPGIDVEEIRVVPAGESNTEGERARNAILAGTDPQGVLGSAADRVTGAIGDVASVAGASLKPLQDILILALALLLVYFILRGRAVTA